MKGIISIGILVAMLLSLCACGSEDSAKSTSGFNPGNSSEETSNSSNELEEAACVYATALWEKDRTTLNSYMLPEFYESVDEMLEDIDDGCVVLSAEVDEIYYTEPSEYENRIEEFFDIPLNGRRVEEACEVYVLIHYIDGEYGEDVDRPSVEMAKIDGKWYGFKSH